MNEIRNIIIRKFVFWIFNLYLLIVLTCFYVFFRKTMCFWKCSLQRLLVSQLFVLFLQYHIKPQQFFQLLWALLFEIGLHFQQNKYLNYQNLQVKCFKFRVLLSKIILLSNIVTSAIFIYYKKRHIHSLYSSTLFVRRWLSFLTTTLFHFKDNSHHLGYSVKGDRMNHLDM